MSTEVIDIVVQERADGSRTVKRNLDDLGASAYTTAGSLDHLTRSSNLAGEGHEHHKSAVISLKQEMAGSQRTVNFFARSLNDVIPASSGAGEALRILGSGLVSGFGIGLGIEILIAGAKLAGEAFTEWRDKTNALEEAHGKFTRLSSAEIDAYGQVAERVAEEQGTKFTDVFKEMAKGANDAYASMDKALADYEASLHKTTAAEKVLSTHESESAKQRVVLTQEVAKAYEKLQAARKSAATPDAGSAISIGPDVDKAQRDAQAIAKATEELKRLQDAVTALNATTSSKEAGVFAAIDLETQTSRYTTSVQANKKLQALELQGALTTANDRKRVELELEAELRTIQAEWLPKNVEYASQLEMQARSNAAGKVLELERDHARQHAAEMRSLGLELASVGLSGETKERLDGAAKLAAIDDASAKAREKDDVQAVHGLGEKRALEERVITAKLIEIAVQREAQLAQARNERLAKESEADNEAATSNMASEWKLAQEARYSAKYGGAGDRVRQIDEQERAELAKLRAGQDQQTLTVEQAEKRRTEITAQSARARALATLEARQLEVQGTREFFGTLATMQNSSIRELAMVGKAAAIAQATIDGILAVQKALATFPPPLSFAIAAAVGVATAANVAQIAGITGFEGGGYTGDLPSDRVAGVVHGREFVSTADATSKYRPVLEAMNAGTLPSASPGGGGGAAGKMTVNVVNQAPGVAHEARQISANEVEIIARSVVHRETPRLLEGQLADSNSRSSRALQSNTTAGPRR